MQASVAPLEAIVRELVGGRQDLATLTLTAILSAARIFPVVFLVPMFGGQMVPATLKIAIALAFSALFFPFIATDSLGAALVIGPAFAALVVKELAVGVVLGFLASLPFHVAQAAGRLADVLRGASTRDRSEGSPSPLGSMGLLLGTVAFFLVGGHLMFVRAMAASYQAIPVEAAVPPGWWETAGEVVILQTGILILAAVSLSAPVLAATLLTDVALGLASRLLPELPAFFLGLSLKAMGGVVMLALALVAIGRAFVTLLAAQSAALDALVRGPGP